jgi:hypothetical protein
MTNRFVTSFASLVNFGCLAGALIGGSFADFFGTVRVFHHGFCCVRVSHIAFEWYCARFSTGIYTRGVPLSFCAFAPLEALPCVCSNGIPLG